MRQFYPKLLTVHRILPITLHSSVARRRRLATRTTPDVVFAEVPAAERNRFCCTVEPDDDDDEVDGEDEDDDVEEADDDPTVTTRANGQLTNNQ